MRYMFILNITYMIGIFIWTLIGGLIALMIWKALFQFCLLENVSYSRRSHTIVCFQQSFFHQVFCATRVHSSLLQCSAESLDCHLIRVVTRFVVNDSLHFKKIVHFILISTSCKIWFILPSIIANKSSD